jgi:hypothetical protein
MSVMSDDELKALEEFKQEGAQLFHLDDYRNPNITYKQILDFPIEIFPKEIREFGEATAESVKAPIDFFGTAMLGAASVFIGHQFQIWTKTDKSILCSLWIQGIGKSGSGKSDMQRRGIAPVIAHQVKLKQEFDKAYKDYKQAKKSGEDDELEEPILKQIIASNSTIEALKDLLEEGSLLLYVDESAGWIKAMGQYKKGASGELEEFLSIADNHTLVVNRKGLRQQIDSPYMSFVGGIQPTKLDQMLTLQLISDDGFLERFLPCFPNELQAEYNAIGANPIYEKNYVDFMSRLLTLNTEKFTKNIMLDDSAKTLFDYYMHKTMEEINANDFDERLESFWRKTFKNLSRLILITHLISCVSSGKVEATVNAYTVQSAIKLMDYFKSHFAKMVRYVLGNQIEKKYESLCAYIMKFEGSMNVRKLAQSKKFGTTQECRDLLQELESAGLGLFLDDKKNDFQLFRDQK